MRKEALGAESGLGLLSCQDSGHIRGRLNLPGTVTMLMVTSCFHLCMSWSSSAILPKLAPEYQHSSSGNRGWAECFPGNSSLTSGKDSDRVSDDAANVGFGSESTKTPCLAHGCQCYVAASKGGEFGGERRMCVFG